ncbi:hypothetical protein [[Mycoplasma] anseris]|uniref:Uncharacterized protein n=1 Tax=[Mycoplasma] anseris TaxID=92400 RepID=A0A2Z4NCP6_9BACT|nr:hypothetical protein [[Mycoplasma] anseris]AWX69341.1 hypothetical protein DP065_01045 [[Mycoplasma] anseris]
MSRNRKVKIILATMLGLVAAGVTAGTAYVLLRNDIDNNLKLDIEKLINEINSFKDNKLNTDLKKHLKNKALMLVDNLNKAKSNKKNSELKAILEKTNYDFSLLKKQNEYVDLANEVGEYLKTIGTKEYQEIYDTLNNQLNDSNNKVEIAKTVDDIAHEIDELRNKLDYAKKEVENHIASSKRNSLIEKFNKLAEDIKVELNNWNDPKYDNLKNSLNTNVNKAKEIILNPNSTIEDIENQIKELTDKFNNSKHQKEIIAAKSEFGNLVSLINDETSSWNDPKYSTIKDELDDFIHNKTEEVTNENNSVENIKAKIEEVKSKYEESKNKKAEIDSLSEEQLHNRLVNELRQKAKEIKTETSKWSTPKFDDIKKPLLDLVKNKESIADIETTTTKELSDAIKELKTEYKKALDAKKAIELNDAKAKFNDLKNEIINEIKKWNDDKYTDIRTNLENSISTKNDTVGNENESIEAIERVISNLRDEYANAISTKAIIDAKSEFDKVLEKANILKDDHKLENYEIIKHYLVNQINLTTNSVETTPTVENINNQKSILENAIEKTNKDYEIAKAGDEYISIFSKAQSLHKKLENNSAEKIKLDQVMVETKNTVEAHDRTKQSIEAATTKLKNVMSEIEESLANKALKEFTDALNKLKTYQKSLSAWNTNAAQPLTIRINDYDQKSKAPNINNELFKQYTKEINELITNTINNVLSSTIDKARTYSKSAPANEYPSIQSKLNNKIAEYNNTSSWSETDKDSKSLELHNYVATIKNEIKEKAYSTFKSLKSNALSYISGDYTDSTTISKINELKSLLSSYDSYNENTDESQLVVANKEIDKRLSEINNYIEHDKFLTLEKTVQDFIKDPSKANEVKFKLNNVLPGIKNKELTEFANKNTLGIRAQYTALKNVFDFATKFNEYYDLKKVFQSLETKYPLYNDEQFFIDAKKVFTSLKTEEVPTINNTDLNKADEMINKFRPVVNQLRQTIMEKERARNTTLSAEALRVADAASTNPFAFKEVLTYKQDIAPLVNYSANPDDIANRRYEKITDEFYGKNNLLADKIKNINDINNSVANKFISNDIKTWTTNTIKETENTLTELNSRAAIYNDGVTYNFARRLIKSEFIKLFNRVTNKFNDYKQKFNQNQNNIAYSIAVQTYAKTIEELYIYYMSSADVDWIKHRGAGQSTTWQKLTRKYYGSQYGANWRGLFTNETGKRIIPKISNYPSRFKNNVISSITDGFSSIFGHESSRNLNIVLTQDGYIPIVTNTLNYVDKFIEILNNMSSIVKEMDSKISDKAKLNQILNHLNSKLQSISSNFTKSVDKYEVMSRTDLQQEFFNMKQQITTWLSNYKSESSSKNIRHEGATLYLEDRLKDYEGVITTSGSFDEQKVALRSLYDAFNNAKRIADNKTSGVVANEHKSFLKSENTNLLIEFFEILIKSQEKYNFSFKNPIQWLPVYKADTIMDEDWYHDKDSNGNIVNSNFINFDEHEWNWQKKYNVLKSRVDFGLVFNMFPSYATESITTIIYHANYAYQLGRYEEAYNKLKNEIKKYDPSFGDPK